MTRLLRWLDPMFGLALAASLLMVAITAWPGAALAADWQRGSGEAATEQRSAAPVDAVQTNGPSVVVRMGATPSISVKADSNLLPLLETVVEDTAHGKTLVVRWKRGASFHAKVDPLVTVTLARVSALVISGSGDIVADALQSPHLSARVQGSGDIRLTGLAVDQLTLAVVGSGDIVASGQARQLAASIAGSGDIQTDALKADEVSVSIAGSGDASVQAEKSLSVSIAGSGDVVYRGNATVTKKVAGSGEVIKR